MIQWVILLVLSFLPILFAVNGFKKKIKQVNNKILFYLKDIMSCVLILLLFLVLNWRLYTPLNFSEIGKGFFISRDTISSIIPIFFIPFIIAFTRWDKNYPKDIATAKIVFGLPVFFLPDNLSQYFLFVLYIIVGVVFEELICRQFMFYSLNNTLQLKGDIIVLISSLLFSVGHLYQGWKGMLGTFLSGIILGKIFSVEENIIYPIVLHLFFNLTIAVLAFRRIKDLKKLHHKVENAN